MSYNADEMNSIGAEINKQIREHVVYNISVEDVIGVQRLKLGKLVGEEGLKYDHIIHGPRILYVLLTFVFNGMLVQGYSPDPMLLGTMVTIPKDKRQCAWAYILRARAGPGLKTI